MKFQITRQNNCIILSSQYHEVINLNCVRQVFDAIKNIDALVLNGCEWVVVSLPEASSVDLNAMQILCRVALYLGKKRCRLAIITDTENCSVIKANTIDSMVHVYACIESFYQSNGIEDLEHVKLFLETLTYSVFETMKVLTHLNVRVEKIESVDRATLSIPSIEAGATVGILCAHFSGSIVVGFQTDVFIRIMSRFLEMEVQTLTEEMKDGGAELLNVVLGQVKMALNDKNFNINQVVPATIFGNQIILTPAVDQMTTLIHYESEVGKFIVLFSANSRQKFLLAS